MLIIAALSERPSLHKRSTCFIGGPSTHGGQRCLLSRVELRTPAGWVFWTSCRLSSALVQGCYPDVIDVCRGGSRPRKLHGGKS
jgi:hypothetical protein